VGGVEPVGCGVAHMRVLGYWRRFWCVLVVFGVPLRGAAQDVAVCVFGFAARSVLRPASSYLLVVMPWHGVLGR